MFKPTFFTTKLTLLAIRFFAMRAARASLRSVVWINENDFYASHIRFIFDIGFEPSKTPSMHSPHLFFSSLHSFSDMGKVFQGYKVPSIHGVNDFFRQNVVTVITETVNFSAKLFQFTLSGLSAFRLQCSFLPKISTFYFLPISRAKKLIVASNRRTVDAQVNASNFAARLKGLHFSANDNMQKVFTLFRDTKVTASYFPMATVSLVIREFKGHLLSATDGRQRRLAFGKSNAAASSIKSNGAFVGFWLRYFLTFLFQGKSGFGGFAGFDPSRTDQLTRQLRDFSFRVIGQFMQFSAIFDLIFPTNSDNTIKRIGVLFDCLIKNAFLFLGKVEFYFQGKSYHRG